MQEDILSDLPNDVIEKIRNAFFIEYVKPKMMMNAPWLALQGCRHNFTRIHTDSFMTNFVARVVGWTMSYLHSFYPSISMNELRGGKEYREYAKTQKFCWVDVVDIEVIGETRRNMTDLKLWFQQEVDCVLLRHRSIRLDFKSHIESTIAHLLRQENIEMTRFEWKPLILKIDFSSELAYFEDPSDVRRSRLVYKHNGEYDDVAAPVKDPIPWLVFFP